MINKITLAFCILISFISCRNEPKKDVKTNKNSLVKDTTLTYIPLKHEVNKFDTILDIENGIKVSIVLKTLDNNIEKIYDNEKTINRDLYRDYSSTIIISKHDSIYFNQTFVKKDFPQIGDEDFFKQAITYNTFLENYNKEKQEIKFTHIIAVPETDWSYIFILTVNKNGELTNELEDIE